MVICAVANTTMSIIKKNNGERDRKASFSRNDGSGSTSTTVSIMIIALTLLLPGGFVILSPITAMTITTALAQEGGGNDTSTTGGTTTTTTTTTSDDITNTATTNTTAATTTRPSSSAIHLSAQPIWQESTGNTGVTPFDQTHSIVTFFGNGTFTVPDTGETINATNNGTALMSSVTGSGYGRESFFSEEDSDSTAITFYEIKKNDPGTSQTKGITIAVFDNNATGSLRPFNDMIVVGLHDEQPSAGVGTRTLWMWESEIGNSTGVDAHPSS
jgi:hypothetical protein